MGNNNATASLTEEESLKVETNGMSPLESVFVETTQEDVFLASEDKDGDKEKESLPYGIVTPETDSENKELVEDPTVKKVEEEINQSGFESSVMENDEQLQNKISVEEEVEDSSMIGTQTVVSKLNTTDFVNEEKPCVTHNIIFENFETEYEKMVNASLEEIVPAEEVLKLNRETGLEQNKGFPETEPQEIKQIIDVDDEVKIEEETISKPGFKESIAVQETGFEVSKEEKDMKLRKEASLKRMSRCRSLPVSHKSRVMGDSLVQQLVSEVTFPSRNKTGLKKPNTSETLVVSCVVSNEGQETTEVINESNKEGSVEMRSPSFGNDQRIEERSDESTEKTPLLCEDKTETYEATIDVEEKTVMLKRSVSEKTRDTELSLGLSMKPSERSEADDSFKENKGSRDNLQDKKATLGSMKDRVRKRSKSSVFGTCLCCATAMN